ncbi:hypothetical protein TPHA_0I02090 [Tetrapisispora phaffii CBS 4417]|uniref:BZIP domain-containing protein n=1 Tax=Tetrapisispora phaffii (strain ATCC 24235 / CBS 4417 / NBRC 1672 / NRRL Y-8282 / UCD 70-5) TaxID=1071381 RepID=G8BXT5_TETPH|nr:hypothetical protein TPHA_0I02090 [Tetrapisispora phaffii CBS 4417]CCE64713.1 hypothetical protein TPHA_0I02090 [Tetrapisispora phaffii CBS 4417]
MSQLLNVKNSDISERLKDLIKNNSELGSQLLSLLIVSSENSKEIIDAINNNSVQTKANLDEYSIPRSLTVSERDLEVDSEVVKSDDPVEYEKCQEELLLEKRRKNIEASARFRQRKKLREQETKKKRDMLNRRVAELYSKIEDLTIENKYWREKIEKINEQKSNELLNEIKLKNTN